MGIHFAWHNEFCTAKCPGKIDAEGKGGGKICHPQKIVCGQMLMREMRRANDHAANPDGNSGNKRRFRYQFSCDRAATGRVGVLANRVDSSDGSRIASAPPAT